MSSRRRHPTVKVKGGWQQQEDDVLKRLVNELGEGQWAAIAKALNEHFDKSDDQGRIGKQCRERWNHHLRPGIKRDAWTEEEEEQLVALHRQLDNRWSDIARQLEGRTENATKNHFNSVLRRRSEGTPESGPGPLKAYLIEIGLIPPPAAGAVAAGAAAAGAAAGGTAAAAAPTERPGKRRRSTASSSSRPAASGGSADPSWGPETEAAAAAAAAGAPPPSAVQATAVAGRADADAEAVRAQAEAAASSPASMQHRAAAAAQPASGLGSDAAAVFDASRADHQQQLAAGSERSWQLESGSVAASSSQGALGLGSTAGGVDGSGSQWDEDLLPLSPTCFDADQHWLTGGGGMSAVASCPALYFAGSDTAAAAGGGSGLMHQHRSMSSCNMLPPRRAVAGAALLGAEPSCLAGGPQFALAPNVKHECGAGAWAQLPSPGGRLMLPALAPSPADVLLVAPASPPAASALVCARDSSMDSPVAAAAAAAACHGLPPTAAESSLGVFAPQHAAAAAAAASTVLQPGTQPPEACAVPGSPLLRHAGAAAAAPEDDLDALLEPLDAFGGPELSDGLLGPGGGGGELQEPGAAAAAHGSCTHLSTTGSSLALDGLQEQTRLVPAGAEGGAVCGLPVSHSCTQLQQAQAASPAVTGVPQQGLLRNISSGSSMDCCFYPSAAAAAAGGALDSMQGVGASRNTASPRAQQLGPAGSHSSCSHSSSLAWLVQPPVVVTVRQQELPSQDQVLALLASQLPAAAAGGGPFQQAAVFTGCGQQPVRSSSIAAALHQRGLPSQLAAHGSSGAVPDSDTALAADLEALLTAVATSWQRQPGIGRVVVVMRLPPRDGSGGSGPEEPGLQAGQAGHVGLMIAVAASTQAAADTVVTGMGAQLSRECF